MASIALHEVTKTFANGHVAARNITIDIADGELLVLLGPSGSGKSTVLRLIAGLTMPTSGQILIDGRDVTAVPPQDRDLAMVFQSYALYPHKSVRENMAFGLRMRHVDEARIAERVHATAAALGLEALLDRRPAQLSGGQRQRVALGRAIVREPKAFLFDEPLSNLDPTLRMGTRAELSVLHRRLRATMIHVTHDQEEAMTLATRIAVMRDGGIEQAAPALDLFHRPANTFVATFVGSPAMNLWTGASTPVDGGHRLVSPAFSIELHGTGVARSAGSAVQIGVRPHDIELAPPGESDGTGRVEVVEPLGFATVIHLRVDGAADEMVRIVLPADMAVDVDQEVGFRLRRDRLHLFDPQSGRRLTAWDGAHG
jgi:ABC-type sugar transport system ATPase subunit